MKKIFCLLTVSILSIDPSFCALPNGIDSDIHFDKVVKMKVFPPKGYVAEPIDGYTGYVPYQVEYNGEIMNYKDVINYTGFRDLIKIKGQNVFVSLEYRLLDDRTLDIDSLNNYSTEVSVELQKSFSEKYGNTPIRIITAESILDGIEEKFPDVNIEHYRKLLEQDNAAEIMKEYVKLADKSYFVGIEGTHYKGCELYELLNDELETAREEFMKMVNIGLTTKTRRQSLVTFLATNEALIGNEGIIIAYPSLYDAMMKYPVLAIAGYRDLGDFCFSGLSAQMGDKVEYKNIPITIDFNRSTLQHELNHATHEKLDTSRQQISFVRQYNKNDFLKDLLFNGLEDIQKYVSAIINKKVKDFTGDELLGFEHNIKEAFGHFFYNDSFISVGDLTKTIENDKQGFIDELSERLSFMTISSLWATCPEEMNNLIGVVYDGETLYINTLSDMDTSLELGEDIRFPYVFIRQGQAELRSEGNVPSQEELENWFEIFSSNARSFNLPTRNSWEMLVKLHQGANNLGIKN